MDSTIEMSGIFSGTRRSIEYLKVLEEHGLTLSAAVLYIPQTIQQKHGFIDEHLREVRRRFAQSDTPFVEVKSKSINDRPVVDAVLDLPSNIVLFSRLGGAILGDDYFASNKRYLHFHPGALPEYRGSTTIYYQYLDSKPCGVSAILLSPELDAGPILDVFEFDYDPLRNLDTEYDPFIRSQALKRLLQNWPQAAIAAPLSSESSKGSMHYIVHPVIRHVVRLAIESSPEKGHQQ